MDQGSTQPVTKEDLAVAKDDLRREFRATVDGLKSALTWRIVAAVALVGAGSAYSSSQNSPAAHAARAVVKVVGLW